MTYDKLTDYARRLVTPDEKARLDRIERRAIQKEEYELHKRPIVRMRRRMGRIS